MAAPIDKMTLFEASKVAKGTGARIRREHELEPLIWYRRGVALWYRQEDNGPSAVVLASQYTADDFRQPYWTTLGPDDPRPPDPPQPPERPDEPGGGGGDGGTGGGGDGGDGPLPPLPPGPGGGGTGGGGGGVIFDGPDIPPPPPGDPATDDDDDPPAPPPQTIEVVDSQVTCTSSGIAFSITAVASPAGAAWSVVFVADTGNTYPLGTIVGSDSFGPQTLGGAAEPHPCCGGTFKLSSLTQGGKGPVVAV